MKRVSRFEYGLRVVWPALWLGIAANLVGIMTLGYYVPSWDSQYMFRVGQKYMLRTKYAWRIW